MQQRDSSPSQSYFWPTVLAVGSVYARKRPEVFIDIAAATRTRS